MAELVSQLHYHSSVHSLWDISVSLSELLLEQRVIDLYKLQN